MSRDYSRLQRKPFLTPIWLTAAGAFGAVCLLALMVWFWAAANSTTIIVIRHAESETNAGADPPLTVKGQAHAAELARLFGVDGPQGRINAIYTSAALRNRMTAAPLAARLGITPMVASTADPHTLARQMIHEHRGGRILIVGHRDTVDDIVTALSGVKALPAIGEGEFGTMYIVSVPRIGRANLLRATF